VDSVYLGENMQPLVNFLTICDSYPAMYLLGEIRNAHIVEMGVLNLRINKVPVFEM